MLSLTDEPTANYIEMKARQAQRLMALWAVHFIITLLDEIHRCNDFTLELSRNNLLCL